MIEFKFLNPKVKVHPTTKINLEYLDKSDAVCITLFSNDLKKVLLVEQYRPGADANTFENVAGLIDNNENPDFAIIRELKEETGYNIDDIEKIYKLNNPLLVSPGYSSEKLYFYAGRLKNDDIIPGKTNFDFGEDIKSHWINIEEIEDYLIDMKTLFSVKYFINIIKGDIID